MWARGGRLLGQFPPPCQFPQTIAPLPPSQIAPQIILTLTLSQLLIWGNCPGGGQWLWGNFLGGNLRGTCPILKRRCCSLPFTMSVCPSALRLGGFEKRENRFASSLANASEKLTSELISRPISGYHNRNLCPGDLVSIS